MRKTFRVLAAALVIAGLFGAYYVYAPRHTPEGQPPLATIQPVNFADFQKLFNEAGDQTRMLVLLSPT
jgi:hypothetical protein